MKYRVDYSQSFLDDVRRQVVYMREQHVAEDIIDRWFGKLLNQIDALEQSPKRHPVDELQSEAMGEPSRKMVFGDYLVFYTVEDSDSRVAVDRFVHGARDRKHELEQILKQYQERTSGRESGRDRGGHER